MLRGREFVMKDSYSFDIDDAGLDASYAAHRDAYIRIFDRLGFDYVIVKATSGAMGGSKSEEFLATRRGRRGHLRPLHAAATTPPTSRPSQVRPPAPVAVRRRARRARRADARTPPPSRRWSTTSTRSSPATTGPGHAGDTLKNVLVVLKHPDGTREPLAIGLPGDREVDQKRLEGQLEPIEVEAVRRGRDSRSTRRWSRATSGPACWGRRTRPGSATWSTPASSRAPAG